MTTAIHNVALLGCAHIHIHDAVAVLRARGDVACRLVWDDDDDRAARWAGELGARVVRSEEEVFSDAAVDAVVLMGETDLHPRHIAGAAAAGKHLYVEKPLATNTLDAARAARLIADSGVIFHCGYHLRELPGHLAMADLVRRGRLGALVRLRGRFCHRGLLDGIFREHPWMVDPARAGWGGFGDLGVHLVDLLGLMAASEVAEVAAHVEPPRRPGTVDPWGEGMLRYESGVLATISAGWTEHGGPVIVEAHGTEGRAIARDGALTVEPARAADVELPDAVPPRAGAALDHFFAALGGDPGAPLVSADEAARHCQILDALYLAAGSERWVEPGRGGAGCPARQRVR